MLSLEFLLLFKIKKDLMVTHFSLLNAVWQLLFSGSDPTQTHPCFKYPVKALDVIAQSISVELSSLLMDLPSV